VYAAIVGAALRLVCTRGGNVHARNASQDVRHAVATAGERPPIPPDCPTPLAHLLRECWHPLPEHRPSAASVLQKISQMGVRSKFLELREKRHREEKERRAASQMESARRDRSLPLSRALFLGRSLSLPPPSLARSRSLSLSFFLSLARSPPLCLARSPSLSLSLSLAQSLAHSPARTLSLAHSRSLSLAFCAYVLCCAARMCLCVRAHAYNARIL
jgi:hypothetical protein